MNRRLQKSDRRRKLEFIHETLGAPETSDGAYKNTLVLAEFRQAGYNFSTPIRLGNDIDSSETKNSRTEEIQFDFDRVNIVNAGLNKTGRDNASFKEDFKMYENMFGLSPFSSLSVSDDTDELQTDSETVINKYESLMEDSTIESSDAKIETNVTSGLESTNSNPISRHHRLYYKPVEQSFSGDESMEVDDNRDVNDNGDEDKKECDIDDDDDDDCDDDDSDNNSDDDGDDDDSDDSDGEDDDNNWLCPEEFADKIDTKIDKVCGDEHDGACKATKQHSNSYSSLKFRRKDRHKDIEAHIKKHIMEIQRKMALLKQRENKKRKRYTKCINSNTANSPVKQLQIQPIKRSKRLAEPIRCAILKRRALRNAWQGCRGSCCGKGCWAKWGWVNIKRVLSDYW